MKVLHLCLTGPYTDGFNYQENMLAKYHTRTGNSVSIIASQWEWSGGSVKKYEGPNQYINKDGVKGILKLKLNEQDQELFNKSCEIMKETIINKIEPVLKG